MKSIHWFALIGALVVAAGLKLGLVASGRVPFNADEAMVALMARHILLGERPIFFYGQAYMGSLDAYLVAAGFSGFGEQVWVIRAIQTILYLGTLVTTAFVGRSAWGGWCAGVLAAWFLAIPCVNMTLYTTASLGGYGEMLLIGNGILLLTLRIANNINNKESKIQGWSWLGLGFLSGLGLWTFGLTLVYSLPALVFLAVIVWRRISSRIRGHELASLALPCTLLVMGFLAGALPWWIYALQNGFGELLGELSGSAIAGVENASMLALITQHLFNLILFGGTVIAGLRPPWGVEWLARPLLPIALAFWIGVMVFILANLRKRTSPPIPVDLSTRQVGESKQHRRAISDSFFSQLGISQNHKQTKRYSNFQPRIQDSILLLSGVGLTLVLGFIVTPFGADPSGRYFLPLSVILALFAALAVSRLQEVYNRWAWGVVVLVLTFNLWGTLQAADHFPPGLTTQFDAETRLDHRHDPALIDFLEDQGERRGYATYWISYPLAFQSEERLIFTPRLPYHRDFRYTPRDDRYLPYSQEVAAADKVAYITGNQPSLERSIREGLAGLGVSWQEKVIGDYHIFYRLSQPVKPEVLGLGGQID